MKELALKTPTKDAKVEKWELVLDNTHRDALDSVLEVNAFPEDPELEQLRKQFVGDIHITEGSLPSFIFATRH